MAKGKGKKKSKAAQQGMPKPDEPQATTLLFPDLHQRILDELSIDTSLEPWYNDQGLGSVFSRHHSTFVMAKFGCNNKACRNTYWTSKKVTIVIMEYPKTGYGAVVFGQRCQLCDQLGAMVLDEDSYIDRVVYRIKRWERLIEPQEFGNGRRGPPHLRKYCEGCKHGYCREADDDDGLGLNFGNLHI